MCEGDTLIAPWSVFLIDYGKSTAVHTTAEWVDYPCREEEDAPRERSPQGDEAEEQEQQYLSRGRTGYYRVLRLGAREDRSYAVAAKY